MEQNANVVTLASPLMRGETAITQVELTKPTAGALRGVRLSDLAGSDVDALLTVLPRISQPALTKAECLNLAPEDLISMAGTVIGFLSPTSAE